MSDAVAGANAPQPCGIGPFGAMRPLRGAMRQAPEERPSVTQLSLTSFIEMNEVPRALAAAAHSGVRCRAPLRSLHSAAHHRALHTHAFILCVSTRSMYSPGGPTP